MAPNLLSFQVDIGLGHVAHYPKSYKPTKPSLLGLNSLSQNQKHHEASSIIDQIYEYIPSFATIKLCLLILLWYSCSSLTNNLGKQILNEFRFPMTLTIAQFGFISFFTYIYAIGFKTNGSRALTGFSKKVFMIVVPLVGFNIIGHSLSSVAIANVPVSFVHTVKAISPFFTVIFSMIFLKTHYKTAVYLSLIPLMAGVILACSFEISFNLIGLLTSLASTVVFVAQNIFSKKLFQDGILDELNLLYYSSLFAFLFMIPLWGFEEGMHLFFEFEGPVPFHILLLFLANGITHFGQNIFAFTILTLVSPVGYSIGSLLKRVFIIVTSIIWFQTPVTTVNIMGTALTFIGLWMYTRAKDGQKHADPILPTTEKQAKQTLQRRDSEMVLTYDR